MSLNIFSRLQDELVRYIVVFCDFKTVLNMAVINKDIYDKIWCFVGRPFCGYSWFLGNILRVCDKCCECNGCKKCKIIDICDKCYNDYANANKYYEWDSDRYLDYFDDFYE